MYYQKTSSSQLKGGQSIKIFQIRRWCHENNRWCWQFYGCAKKLKECCCAISKWDMILFFSKLAKTFMLVRKRWFFSKVIRMQGGQVYLSIKIVCDTDINQYFHHILQSCDHNLPLSAAGILKITLGVMYDQRLIINNVIYHKDSHKAYLTVPVVLK